jgi:hypothetical protein
MRQRREIALNKPRKVEERQMKRHFLHFQAGPVLAALLLIPTPALAQNPYEGIYFGTFHGLSDDGEFALIVNDQGHGTLAAFDSMDDSGFIEKNIHVRSDGSFRFLTRRGVLIDGQATASDISGRYADDGIEGGFSGLKAAVDGPLQDAAGYYEGPASITGTDPGADWVVNNRMVAIIAADGNAFFLLDRAFPWLGEFWLGDYDPDFGPGRAFPGPDTFWPGVFDFGLDLDLGLGFGFDLDLDVGHHSAHYPVSGFCRPFQYGRGFRAWPFDFGWNYSFRISLPGPFDLDFDFSYDLPTCNAPWTWNHFPAAVGNSGGMVQIEPDGYIQGTLLDGLALQGYLDTMTAKADGILFQQEGDTDWFGQWEIDRRFTTDTDEAVKHSNRLSDLNGDGFADIIWHHAVTGKNAIWLMDGAEILAELPLELQGEPQTAPSSRPEQSGDKQPDLVWRHESNGGITVWLSNDAEPVRFAPDPASMIVGAGDFDGDGSMDILWRDYAAGIAMITTSPSEEAPEHIQLAGNLAPEWLLGAIGDLDGDGFDDLVWRNSLTGEYIAWRVVDGQVVEAAPLRPVPDLHWTIQP